MDRRKFLKRIALGAIATLVAPSVLARATSAAEAPPPPAVPVAPKFVDDPRLVPTIDILKTDHGTIAMQPGETEGAALMRAEASFCNGVSPAAPEVQSGSGPPAVGRWSGGDPFFTAPRAPYAGGTPRNEVSDAISFVEWKHGKISAGEYHNRVGTFEALRGDPYTTTASTNITIPLTYGTFQTVPASRAQLWVATSTSP